MPSPVISIPSSALTLIMQARVPHTYTRVQKLELLNAEHHGHGVEALDPRPLEPDMFNLQPPAIRILSNCTTLYYIVLYYVSSCTILYHTISYSIYIHTK